MSEILKKPAKAVERNYPVPQDEIKEVFTKMIQKLEKGFSEAAK